MQRTNPEADRIMQQAEQAAQAEQWCEADRLFDKAKALYMDSHMHSQAADALSRRLDVRRVIMRGPNAKPDPMRCAHCGMVGRLTENEAGDKVCTKCKQLAEEEALGD